MREEISVLVYFYAKMEDEYKMDVSGAQSEAIGFMSLVFNSCNQFYYQSQHTCVTVKLPKPFIPVFISTCRQYFDDLHKRDPSSSLKKVTYNERDNIFVLYTKGRTRGTRFVQANILEISPTDVTSSSHDEASPSTAERE